MLGFVVFSSIFICRKHAMIWTWDGRDDTTCCGESSLRRVQSVTSGLPCFPVAETLPRRDETQFPEKVRAQSVMGVLVQEWQVAVSFYLIHSFRCAETWRERSSEIGRQTHSQWCKQVLHVRPSWEVRIFAQGGLDWIFARDEASRATFHVESLYVNTPVLVLPHHHVRAKHIFGWSWWFANLRSLFFLPMTYPFWSYHEGEMTRPTVQSLLCAESNLWHQDCLTFQSQRSCQDVMRHNFLKKYERRASFHFLVLC